MTPQFDLAVVGSGFGGSLLAMIARRLGLSVALLERGRHPRTVIGESSTPLSNLLLEELTERYDLPRLRPLTKWGTWQQSYPKIGCGLKRGFSFFHHELGSGARGGRMQDNQMLVAASPHDSIADTHWYRADFDELLVREAQALGVEYVDELELRSATRESGGWRLGGVRRRLDFEVTASFIVDATGPRGFLARALSIGELALPDLPDTAALYTHFDGVTDFAPRLHSAPCAGAGYAPDAAALHHVFEGGWIWVLRFNNGATSAGVAATREVATHFDLAAGQPGWERLLASLPDVQGQFTGAQSRAPFTFLPRLGFRNAQVAGPGWAMLPSAAGFVDPLLSTGFPLTLLGISRVASLFEHHWGTPELERKLHVYARQTDDDLLATARLIGALYRSMGDFSLFRSLCLLYFAAASFSETARRLGRPERAGSFLLQDDPVFGPESRRLLALPKPGMSSAERSSLEDAIGGLVEPFDVAGLCRRPADHCYPVRAEDLYNGAHLVGASRPEIDAMLERSGFFTTTMPG